MIRQRSASSIALFFALMLGACVTRTQSAAPNVAPQLVIEQFLRAVNGVFDPNDAVRSGSLDTMGKLFGTRDGPIVRRDSRREVEQRMYALASILRHDDYKITGQQVVPGRKDEAIRIIVGMTFGTRQIAVPWTIVRTTKGSWLVEQIDVELITSRP